MGVIANVQKFLKKNRFFGYGIPFMVLLVSGSFALKQFAQLRYTFRRKQLVSEEEAAAIGVKMKPSEEKPTLEDEFQKLQNMKLDSWENVRGPRPWESTTDLKETAGTSRSSS